MKRIILILLSFIVALCPLAPFVCANEYTDVTADYEGYTGYATREQAIACFVNAMGVEKFKVDTSILNKYKDKDKVSYPYVDEMSTAVYLGLINGYDDNTLRPRENISRVEALVILNRALKQAELSDWYDVKFSDTPDWAEKQINRLASAGIVKGYGDGTVGAKDFLTIIQVNTLCDRIERVMGPMGDFYNFVNKDWLEKTKLTEGESVRSEIGALEDTMNSRLTGIIVSLYKEHYNEGKSFPKDSDQGKIVIVYSAVANQEYRDKIGIAPIKPMLDMIEKSKNTEAILNTMAELERNGFPTMIKVSFNPDVQGDRKYLPAISGSYTGINPNLYRGKGEAPEIYKAYIKRLFEISGEVDAEAKAEKAVGLCRTLAESGTLTGGRTDLSRSVSIYSKEDLNKLYGDIDMGKYFFNVGYSKMEKVILYDKELAERVASLICQENLDDIKAYLKASVLDSSALYLNTEMFNAYQEYQNGMNDRNDKNNPVDFGTGIIQEFLGWELGDIYVEKYFPENSKLVVDEMTKAIIERYKKLISSSGRMSQAGKAGAIRKLENMKVCSAYPDNIDDYKKKVALRPIEEGGSLMEYRMQYARESIKNCSDILSGKKEAVVNDWSLYPQTVNAMYDHISNSITIPAGILQEPFFEASAGYEENLGGIGTVIAHEISHAFDATGAQFDENGKLKNWWTEQDKEEFNILCEKIADQYSDIKFGEKYINGELTLNENIADIAGVSCIISLIGEDDEMLGDMFESYARVWRIKSTMEYDNNMLLIDTHSPNKVRVNRVLSNFEAFNDFYGVEEGDGMYIPDENRIDIWK